MQVIFSAPAVLLLALASPAWAGNTEAATVGEFLISLPTRNLDSIIDYCLERAPETGEALLREKEGFIEILDEATNQLLEEIGNEPGFDAPLPEGLRRKLDRAQESAMELVRQRDPEVVCRAALANMRGATVDQLRTVVEANYRKFSGAGRAGAPD